MITSLDNYMPNLSHSSVRYNPMLQRQCQCRPPGGCQVVFCKFDIIDDRHLRQLRQALLRAKKMCLSPYDLT